MIVLDPEKLSDFFKMVSRGFERTLLDIILLAVAVAAFLGLLLAVYLLQRRQVRRQGLRAAWERYAELRGRLGLLPSEEALLEELSRFLSRPEKKYLLLANQGTFNYCAQKLREAGTASTASLSALRLKLGFQAMGPERVPASSADLPAGQSLLIVSRGRERERRAQGRIVLQEREGPVVRLASPDPGFAPEEPLQVYFQNRAGLFSFPTSLRERRTGAIQLAHAEAIRRVQRRRYYRRKVSLPVWVRKAAAIEDPRPSTLVDLSGEGACLRSPGGDFRAGEDLELTFEAGGERFQLLAEVLRTSRNGEHLHVRFGPMRESLRDRIIGSLFRSAV